MIRQTAKLPLIFFSAYIALGQRPSPNCSYVIDSKEWTLTGFCTVVTQYQMGWCEWRAKNTTENLKSGNLTTTKERDNFWNCSVKLEIPLPNGLYTCEVLFEEFEYNNSWRDAFSVRINDPGQPILKNCPEHVTEGESVTCECSSERDGEPRLVFSWPGHTDSSILRLYEVRTNMTHTCEMSWGKKRTTALYTFTVSSNIVTHTNNNEVLITIIGVAAVLINIVVTTCIIISTIRRKSKSLPIFRSFRNKTVLRNF